MIFSFAVYENKQEWDAAVNKTNGPDYCRSRLNSEGVLCVFLVDPFAKKLIFNMMFLPFMMILRSVMEVLSGKWPTNVVQMRSGLLETFSGLAGHAEGTVLSLATRVDISKNAKAIQDSLDELEKASGVKMEVEVDYLALLNSVVPAKRKQAQELGMFVLRYIKCLVKECVRAVKDDLNKEAFTELCKNKKIKFHIFEDVASYEKAAPKLGGVYGRGRVVDGDLVVELNNTNFFTNVETIFKFDKMFSA